MLTRTTAQRKRQQQPYLRPHRLRSPLGSELPGALEMAASVPQQRVAGCLPTQHCLGVFSSPRPGRLREYPVCPLFPRYQGTSCGPHRVLRSLRSFFLSADDNKFSLYTAFRCVDQVGQRQRGQRRELVIQWLITSEVFG